MTLSSGLSSSANSRTYEEAASVHQAQSDEEAIRAIRDAAEALLARKVEATTDPWRDCRALLSSLDPALQIKRIISQADKFASKLRTVRSRLRPTGQALWTNEE